jgi:TPR repeat protein
MPLNPPGHTGSYSHMSNQGGDIPNFSPFPKINPRPPNVPPSDDEKEEILESARVSVLNSNDPEMQLAWAQDALAFVSAAQTHEEKMAESRPARPATPAIEHRLRLDAMNIVSFLADQHHPKAEFMKGMWLEFGNFGLRQDKREAFRCYARASEKGFYRADYRMGMQFEQNNDPVKALIHYQKGAANGDAASNYRLGMMTLMGQMGQAQDFAKGLHMLRIAAEHADENAPQGSYVLGMLQARELPQVTAPEVLLPYNVQDARINIEKAAYLGFAKAQLKMGSAYELCSLGCEFNPALSMHYNALAARQGEAEAEMAISKWFLCGHESVFSKNEQLAYEYAERAAQSGLSTAEFAMGYFNEIGVHVSVNIEKAKYWYDLAAKSGNQDAVGRIASLNNSQQLSKKDHENIAISRIKSQHGSLRGKRPERLKAQAPSLPSVSDEGEYSPSGVVIPPRGSSITPYPMSDGPPAVSTPPNRPPTVTPYPIDNGPPKVGGGPGGFAGGFAPELRSHSAAPAQMRHSSVPAFNINPNLYDQGPPNDPYSRPYSGQGRPPQRPATTLAAGDVNPGYGPGGRAPSGPPATGGNYGPGPGPGRFSPNSRPQQGQPQSLSNLDIGYAAAGKNNQQGPSPSQRPHSAQDIGYVAPLQPKKPANTILDSTSPAGANYNSPPRKDSRPSVPGAYPQGLPANPSSVTSRPPQSAAGTPTSARPPRKESMQSQPQPPAKTSTAPAKMSGANQQPAKQSAKPPPTAGGKPGKGPKTFDEMGIQAGKDQGDCVSSASDFFVEWTVILIVV